MEIVEALTNFFISNTLPTKDEIDVDENTIEEKYVSCFNILSLSSLGREKLSPSHPCSEGCS